MTRFINGKRNGRGMKQILVLLLLALIACTAPIPQEAPRPSQIIEKVLIQCPDGTLIQNNQQCPISQPIQPPIIQETKEPIEIPKTETVTPTKTLLAQHLEKVPEMYWFYDIDEGVSNAVKGNMRFSFQTGKLFDTQIMVEYKKRGQLLTGTKYFKEKKDTLKMFGTPTTNEIPVLQTYTITTYPLGPVDYMKQYATEQPVLIENSSQILKLFGRDITSNVQLHFIKKDNPKIKIVMRLDDHYGVPLIIEEILDTRTVSRKQFWFDVHAYDGFTRINFDPKWFELPSAYILMNDDEWREYSDSVEN